MGLSLQGFCKNVFSTIMGIEDDSLDDPLLWSRDLRLHSLGEFSVSVVQANKSLEDQMQVETSRHGTFVGVYDGHIGNDCSKYVAQHLFPNFLKFAKEKTNGAILDAIRDAFMATDEEFIKLAGRTMAANPVIVATGSCCLVGIIWKDTIYVANAGNSRAVLGRLDNSNTIVAQQLSDEHTLRNPKEMTRLVSQNRDDINIILDKDGQRAVKGLVQYTRTIGDADLKRPDLALSPRYAIYHRRQLPEPLKRPVLTAEPSIRQHVIQPEDRFLIFASDGLWNNLSNRQAVEIVSQNPRHAIARRLIRAAIQVAETTNGLTYDRIKKKKAGPRRLCHDDISVVVLYMDQEMLGKGPNLNILEESIKGYTEVETPSNLTSLVEVGN